MDFPTIDPSAFDEDQPRRVAGVHDIRVQELNLEFPMDALQLIKREYPRIYKQVILMWGRRELQERLTKLTLTDQQGRRGWSRGVGEALVSIALHHEALFKYEVTPNWNAPRDRW